jgi:hypothetical protein
MALNLKFETAASRRIRVFVGVNDVEQECLFVLREDRGIYGVQYVSGTMIPEARAYLKEHLPPLASGDGEYIKKFMTTQAVLSPEEAKAREVVKVFAGEKNGQTRLFALFNDHSRGIRTFDRLGDDVAAYLNTYLPQIPHEDCAYLKENFGVTPCNGELPPQMPASLLQLKKNISRRPPGSQP